METISQVKLKKAGNVIYPRTVGDAVSVNGETLTNALDKKQDKLTTYSETSGATNIANINATRININGGTSSSPTVICANDKAYYGKVADDYELVKKSDIAALESRIAALEGSK